MSSLQTIADSPAVWFCTCARIINKDAQLIHMGVDYPPNAYQLKILEAYEWCLFNGIPCRILALKPRQKGSTTISAAIIYHHCRRYRTRAVQIGDRYKTSNNLFAMTNRYAEHDDFIWGNRWESTQDAALITTPEGKEWSRIDKDTAENPRAGRSGTLQALHVSEAAHFPNGGEKSADKTMLSMMNSLADVANSVAIVETTANGAGGWFYEQWQGAAMFDDFKAGRRGNGWIKIFSPWFEFPDSVLPVSPGVIEDLKATLADREQAGIELHGWTWEQIAYRRHTMAQKCGNSDALFDQEYPEDEDRAFLTSGRPRFSARALTRLRLASGSIIPKIGYLHRQGDKPSESAVSWEPNESGWAMIYEEPKEDGAYLIWCDTSTGSEQTADSKDPDRHSVLVLRKAYQDQHGEIHNHKLVARIRPPCVDDWHILEEKVIALCLYYGRCLIGVEVPMGLTLLEGLKRAGMPLFKRKPLSPNSGVTEKPGFQTNSATKPLIIASLSKAIDEPHSLDVYDSHVISELCTFVIHKDGSEAAIQGKHDDDVMSLAMGIHNIGSATDYRGKPAKAKLPPDIKRWKPLHR